MNRAMLEASELIRTGRTPEGDQLDPDGIVAALDLDDEHRSAAFGGLKVRAERSRRRVAIIGLRGLERVSVPAEEAPEVFELLLAIEPPEYTPPKAGTWRARWADLVRRGQDDLDADQESHPDQS